MKSNCMPLLGFVLLFSCNVIYAEDSSKTETISSDNTSVKVSTDDQKTLYFLGQAVSAKIKPFGFANAKTKFIIQGFSGALSGNDAALDEKTYGDKLKTYLKDMRAGSQSSLDKKEEQKTLLFLGQSVSSSIKKFGFNAVEAKFITQGFSETLDGKGENLDEKIYSDKLNAYLKPKQDLLVSKEKEKNMPFLEKMSKETGAQKLPSGMIYIPVQEGTGAHPKASDTVKVNYHGIFPDGKVFDSSVDRGEPAEFPLGGVIKCWSLGLQKMKVGGKAKLICPSETAYGDLGAGSTVPGGATLVFQVELLEILKSY